VQALHLMSVRAIVAGATGAVVAVVTQFPQLACFGSVVDLARPQAVIPVAVPAVGRKPPTQERQVKEVAPAVV
jgi:hypothetical protein